MSNLLNDTDLIPPGMESVCAMPYWPPPRFPVEKYGGFPNTGKDALGAVRAAQADAEASGGGLVTFSPGVWCLSLPDNDPPVFGSQVFKALFKITDRTSNVVFHASPDPSTPTEVRCFCENMADPKTTFTQTGLSSAPFIRRFFVFHVFADRRRSPVRNFQIRNLIFRGGAGWTGKYTDGGDPLSGDGWDYGHKFLSIEGSNLVDNILCFNVTATDFRGEIVHAGGTNIRALALVASRFASSNASAVSCSADFLMHSCVVGDDRPISMYQGVENFAVVPGQKTVITGKSRVAGAFSSGVAILGTPGTSAVIEDSDIVRTGRAVLLSDLASSVRIRGNRFHDNKQGVIASIIGGPNMYAQFPKGFHDVALEDNTADNSGGLFLRQTRVDGLAIRRNRITNGYLLGGTFDQPRDDAFEVEDNILGAGAKDISSYKAGPNGPLAALWRGTQRTDLVASSNYKVDDYDPTPGHVKLIAPLTDVTLLNDNKAPGPQLFDFDAKAMAGYPVGFETLIVVLKKEWTAKANPLTNTLASDTPMPARMRARLNEERLFEFLPA